MFYHDTFKFAQPKYTGLNEVAAEVKRLLTSTPRDKWGSLNYPPAMHQIDILTYIDDYIKDKLDNEQEALKNVRSELLDV
jgi:hypothetical protein